MLQKLYQVNLFGGVKLGLSNTLALDRALDFPSTATRFIHIAGTNGKGSVSTKIAKALEYAGYRVGLYTSPHISCFRERIRINDEMISEADVVAGLQKIFDLAAKEELNPTFFEYATMLALNYFRHENVDFAVLETGLGGRLDATNIVIPDISIITSISLEHTEILGKTVEAIAMEKAGIIKALIPVVIGPRVPPEIIKAIAAQKGSPLFIVNRTFETFDQENCAIAEEALKLLTADHQAINGGLKALPPCRMETLKIKDKTVILDVGHNPDGLTQLFKALPQKQPGIIFGLSKSKDIEGCICILKNHGSHFYPVEAPNGRGVPSLELEKHLQAQGISKEKITRSFTISDGIKNALKQHDFILICGTFFIMGGARKALQIIEPFDTIDVNEKFNKDIKS